MMKLPRITAFAVLMLASGCFTPVFAAEDKLTVHADAASVPISPRPAGRRFLRPPTIEFEFSVEAECRDDRMPGSLSVSIADTHRNFNAVEMAAAPAGKFVIKVPAKQIAPIALDNFCLVENSVESVTQQQIHVRDVLSAQISLMCISDNDKIISYRSHPLDVVFICIRNEESDQKTSEM